MSWRRQIDAAPAGQRMTACRRIYKWRAEWQLGLSSTGARAWRYQRSYLANLRLVSMMSLRLLLVVFLWYLDLDKSTVPCKKFAFGLTPEQLSARHTQQGRSKNVRGLLYRMFDYVRWNEVPERARIGLVVYNAIVVVERQKKCVILSRLLPPS